MSAVTGTNPATVGANNGVHPPPVADEVLLIADAAAFLRVPEDAVRQEAAAGKLPGRLIAGEWRFSRVGILAWLATPEPAPIRLTATQWLKDNPRVWDEQAEREAEAEIAEMRAHRESLGTVLIGDSE